MKLIRTTTLTTLIALCLLASCTKNAAVTGGTPQPLVQNVQSEVVRMDRPSVSAESIHSPEVKVTAVVDKAALLNQEFLYGADLQYSSVYDKGMDLYNQSMSVGHVPARFRIAGNELQLVADNRRLFPSDNNHPEQLLTRFKILSQTSTTLTISDGNSGVYLASVLQGTHDDTQGGLTAPVSAGPLDRWTRSFEFVAKGDYLLQQTSIVLADGKGSIGEFMESIFPRATLTPGEKFETFEMNPNNPIGGDTEVLTRFRFLAGENIFSGEKKLAFGQHFDISKTSAHPEGTIDWYVTRNIPDESLGPVKLAVEGWNRYFKKFKGIEREVVRFKGRLPEGLHLGDPRFNVINWDSRLVAGAAYETQASDPQSGKQSHSMIYLPAAWLQIGFDYWKAGEFSEAKTESVAPGLLAAHGGPVLSSRLSCLRDLRDSVAYASSGRLNADEIKEFGVRLLKQTLFHEVGHALGLAHNFKGSLSFDRSKADSIFSTSIMDYNDFEIERGAFNGPDTSDGPLLEYDRQALSAIYNKEADIDAKDPVVPTCNDAEADVEDSDGVDPLCSRYDIENDPTLSVNTALDRIGLAVKIGDVSLPQALGRVPALILTPEVLAAVKTKDDLKMIAAKVAAALKGSMKFYLTSGKASLSRVVRTNVKSLLKFQDEILPAGYNELQMRERAFNGVQKALALRTLPEAVSTALTQAEKTAGESLDKTPYLQGLNGDDRRKLSETFTQAIDQVAQSIVKDEAAGLPKLRSSILTALARHKKIEYFFGKPEGATDILNYEASLVGLLGDAVTSEPLRTQSERLAAATSLMSYKGRLQGDAAIAAVKAALNKTRAAVTDNHSREDVEALLSVMDPALSSTDE